MTDNPQRDDPSLGSLGRHLLGGGVLGLGVGASWEVMAWFWATGQFAPLRLLTWGASLGLTCGFVIWLARAGHERPRRRSAAPVNARHSSAELNGVGLTWRSFWVHVASGTLGGVVCAPSYVAIYWYNSPGERVFAFVGCIALGVAAGACVWVARACYADAKAGRTSRGADPLRPGKHPGQPAPAFEHRLAQFLDCTAEELLRPRPRPQSKMPFWSIVDFRSYCGPKPVWIIRRILERIRATVRRSRI